MRRQSSGPRWGRTRWISLVAILCVGLAAVGLLSAGRSAWATDRQSSLHQTVPTNTPTREPTAISYPTDTPQPEPPTHTPVPTSPSVLPTVTPSATSAQQTATATRPVVTATATPTPSPSPLPTAIVQKLILNQSASSLEVLPGAELVFTLQLTNPGPKELKDVRIEDVLPSSLLLQNVEVYLGEVDMVGNRAIVLLERLAPGLTSVITVRVRVAANTPLGWVIEHSPVVYVGAELQRWPPLMIALPPAELPATGAHRRYP